MGVLIIGAGIAQAFSEKHPTSKMLTENYEIQWEMNFGTDDWYGARYEGPQPIGDCDNDGDNELLISGRDAMIRVMEWNDGLQTYEETHVLRCPFYPLRRSDAGGMAIGDLTGDGENEIAASWSTAVHKWVDGRYKIIGYNPYVFWTGGGSADCLIGDCDNDGKNELIMSGGPFRFWSRTPEIVVFKWNGWRLVKTAVYDDPMPRGYVYMAGIGDVDEDGENELVCGIANRGDAENLVVVLDWNNETKAFMSTIIEKTEGWEQWPFACICKDSDMDGKNEIHVGYYCPRLSVFEWNGTGYTLKYLQEWKGEAAVIEALDVGDVDNDGINEVCVGTNVVHILQWNGSGFTEEALLPTWGGLAVTSIGDCDNDGKNEINVGNVWIYPGEKYMSWVFKYIPT
ncbi:MAG: VCBS repeat-containing protein [Candidatus Thermoplasmatota archaeon]|nr:VCBS repeat-containing protein [Candidatus Thermoplasmatota archaeon]MBU1941042.1 VCBS repeat-containing protein [Candidatus Thermoplasmatota archaeon]